MPQRVLASVSGSLGLVGLLLAAVGIYGVMAFAVTLRTREFGIRVALGAQRGDVMRMVIRRGLVITAIGCTIGLGLAALLAQPLTLVLLDGSPIGSGRVRRRGGAVHDRGAGAPAMARRAARSTRIR